MADVQKIISGNDINQGRLIAGVDKFGNEQGLGGTAKNNDAANSSNLVDGKIKEVLKPAPHQFFFKVKNSAANTDDGYIHIGTDGQGAGISGVKMSVYPFYPAGVASLATLEDMFDQGGYLFIQSRSRPGVYVMFDIPATSASVSSEVYTLSGTVTSNSGIFIDGETVIVSFDSNSTGGANPFDQDLNTTDDVIFNSLSLSTAYNPFNQNLNTTNNVQFSQIDGRGNLVVESGNFNFNISQGSRTFRIASSNKPAMFFMDPAADTILVGTSGDLSSALGVQTTSATDKGIVVKTTAGQSANSFELTDGSKTWLSISPTGQLTINDAVIERFYANEIRTKQGTKFSIGANNTYSRNGLTLDSTSNDCGRILFLGQGSTLASITTQSDVNGSALLYAGNTFLTGNVGIQTPTTSTTYLTALLTIGAGGTGISKSPLKLLGHGSLMNTPESGSIEFSNAQLYFTPNNKRKSVQLNGYDVTNVGYTVTSTDSTLECQGGTFALTMLNATSVSGKIYNIINNGTGTLTIITSGGQTIDGLSTIPVSSGVGYSIQSDGGHWHIISTKNKARQQMQIASIDWTTNCAVGDGKGYLHIASPIDNTKLVYAHAQCITSGTTGTMDVQLARIRSGTPVDMLSTKLTIDSGETGSDTAATPYIINTSNNFVMENDLIRVDVDAVHTVPAQGLLITLGFE